MDSMMQVKVADIVASSTNPRTDFTDGTELLDSIKAEGIKLPLLVRPTDGHKYEIVDGERRWRTAKKLNLKTVPAIVRKMTDEEALTAQMISHLQRRNISPIEEATAFRHLHDQMKKEDPKRNAILAISHMTGKPEPYIHQVMMLVNLSAKAKEYLTDKVLTLDHAVLLAKMTPEDQKLALEWVIDRDTITSAPSARPLRSFKWWIEQEVSYNLANAPWDKKSPELIAGVPACVECPKNSAFNTTLFPEANGRGFCQDRACFKAKMTAYRVLMHRKTRKEDDAAFIMISTLHHINADEPNKIREVKTAGHYVEVTEKNRCEHTKRAQWIDGPNKHKLTWVCNYSKCTKHWKNAPTVKRAKDADDYNAPKNVLARRKARNAESLTQFMKMHFREEVINAVRQQFKGPVTTDHLRGALALLAQWADRDVRPYVARILGFDVEAYQKPKDEDVRKALLAFTEDQLPGVMFALGNAWMFDPYDRHTSDATRTLNVLASKYEVNLKEIKAREDAYRASLMRCEVCGCTVYTACAGGCAWDDKFVQAKRTVCTQCVEIAKPIDAKAEGKPEDGAKQKKGAPKK